MKHESYGTVGAHFARRRRVDSGDEVEKRGLTATGRPDDGHEAAARDVEAEVLKHLQCRAVGRGKRVPETFDDDVGFVRHGHTCTAGRQTRSLFSKGLSMACSMKSMTMTNMTVHAKTWVIENSPNQ